MLARKDIIDFIKRYDETFKIKENIYYASKAFKTNSVINYLGEMKDEDNLNYEEAEQVFNLLIICVVSAISGKTYKTFFPFLM